jgi:DnaK suppressor protein
MIKSKKTGNGKGSSKKSSAVTVKKNKAVAKKAKSSSSLKAKTITVKKKNTVVKQKQVADKNQSTAKKEGVKSKLIEKKATNANRTIEKENTSQQPLISSSHELKVTPGELHIAPEMANTVSKPNTNKLNRYSEKDLAEFKTLLINKLDQAKRDYELLKNTLCHTDDHGTDDTSPTFKALEDGSDVLTREETAQLALRQEKFIQNLQNALIRIENKTYGICRVTGKLIPKERLLRVPHATLSIDAKLEQQFNQ